MTLQDAFHGVGRAIQAPRPPGFVAHWPPAGLASGSNYTGFVQLQRPLVYHIHSLNIFTTISQSGTSDSTHNNLASNQFMEKLLEKTIPGAGFDPFARDPPPRCLPGTRLAILERCLHFIRTCNGKRKTRWVVGAAGVGKRDDGTKAVVTISYQLAAKSNSVVLTNLSDSWSPSCWQKREGKWGEGDDQDWTTSFNWSDWPDDSHNCNNFDFLIQMLIMQVVFGENQAEDPVSNLKDRHKVLRFGKNKEERYQEVNLPPAGSHMTIRKRMM
ncbi:hypothetical protein AGABI2DRAFT_179614 [Agaricus bisporus var. bisporus H97]|uniref:hypothetical protein n=1 Tax=Agaricus bisporus var. bisporus (strain H97 / ATCC MYA-4626 / FGSC 10389) TaxID=936046 RepID=UPI00029F51B5|nr:hypothetical protein AGABI2DRAFT_179614 [Agaricus bisporus var. bisporus H97]EKV45024.1 hypothetical protein AGABI2DRAFT_179614 [Agaricus bisporus var. bisporus H97]